MMSNIVHKDSAITSNFEYNFLESTRNDDIIAHSKRLNNGRCSLFKAKEILFEKDEIEQLGLFKVFAASVFYHAFS